MATMVEPPVPDDESVDQEEVQERNEAMAVMTTLGEDRPVEANPDGAMRDFVFLDENGQLVQQRFVQFLNTL